MKFYLVVAPFIHLFMFLVQSLWEIERTRVNSIETSNPTSFKTNRTTYSGMSLLCSTSSLARTGSNPSTRLPLKTRFTFDK